MLIAEKILPEGVVDERSVWEVLPRELLGFTQCHFFAGIGGWPYALQLAGCPEDFPLWTGSCPCQPFSNAGKGKGLTDERHLWPAWYHLLCECRPPVVLGEQVDAAIRYGWLDLVFDDLEGAGYACGAVSLPAASVGTPHQRQRLYWLGALPHAHRMRPQRQRTSAPWTWPLKQFERLVQTALRLSVPSGESGGVVDGFSARVGALRAYGNAIVPQVAAEVITAYLDTL